MKNVTSVEEVCGFNFRLNTLEEGTHTFECSEGVFVCTSPEEDERFKDQIVSRVATSEEAVEHFYSLSEETKKQ